MAARTRLRVASATGFGPSLRTYETVARETPATRATSRIDDRSELIVRLYCSTQSSLPHNLSEGTAKVDTSSNRHMFDLVFEFVLAACRWVVADWRPRRSISQAPSPLVHQVDSAGSRAERSSSTARRSTHPLPESQPR